MIFILSIVMLTFTAESVAAVFAEGLRAYKSADYAKAKTIFTQLAEQGDVMSQRHLAEMYDKGRGVKKDYSKAIYWYRKAADQKDSKSQYHLGIKYMVGSGVGVDTKQAYAWFALAFEYGYKPAAASIKTLNKTMSNVDRQAALLIAENMLHTNR